MNDAKETRAYWLTQGMARVLGISLSSAIRSGALSHDGLEAMVDRCGHCAHADACLGWLARQQGEVGTAPDYCANRAALAALPPRRH